MSFFILIPVTLLCLFIVVVFLTIALRSPERYLRKKKPSDYSEKMPVDFKDCYLIATSVEKEKYTPPDPTSASVVHLLDPNLYDQDSHPYSYFTSIVYEKDGRKYYSKGINKDRTTVEHYMMIQRSTFIYFNRHIPDDYLFDISFISD